MSTRKGKHVTAKLYVPPHARAKIVDKRAESGHTAEQIKLCDDSNLLFLKAQESEERNARFYLTNLKTTEESRKEYPANNFEGEMIQARPKTCAVPAKRLVSNALGIKAVFSDIEEQEHLQILNERERRKQKQNGNKTI